MADIPNNYYRTSIKALILDDQKRFLLLKEDNGYWELPGGGLNFGEKPVACLIREMREETGLEVTYVNEQPSYFVTALSSKGVWKANVLYEARVRDLNFMPSDECVELRYFTKEEAVKENLFPIVKEFLNVFNPSNHESI